MSKRDFYEVLGVARGADVGVAVEIQIARTAKPVVLVRTAGRIPPLVDAVAVLAGEDELPGVTPGLLLRQAEGGVLQIAVLGVEIELEPRALEDIPVLFETHVADGLDLFGRALVIQPFTEHGAFPGAQAGSAACFDVVVLVALQLIRVDEDRQPIAARRSGRLEATVELVPTQSRRLELLLRATSA